MLLLLSPVLLQCPLQWVSMCVQSANMFVPITVFLYSPCFFIWLSYSHFILYNTFSKVVYSSILVQFTMFLLVTFLLISNHLLLQFYLCLFVWSLISMTKVSAMHMCMICSVTSTVSLTADSSTVTLQMWKWCASVGTLHVGEISVECVMVRMEVSDKKRKQCYVNYTLSGKAFAF